MSAEGPDRGADAPLASSVAGREEPPAERQAPTPVLRPRPRLRRLSRSAVSVALLGGLFLMMVLTLRYSRESLAARPEAERPTTGPQPVSLERLERLSSMPPPRAPRPAEPAEVATTLVPPRRQPSPRPPRPARFVDTAYRSPLSPARAVTAPAATRQTLGDLDVVEGELARLEGELARVDELGRGAGAELGAPSSAARAAAAVLPAATVSWRPPATSYLLRAGTYVPAVVTHRVVSDQAGLVQAVVSRDVYDSVSGLHLLIPRGTVLLGEQGALPTLGESRLAVRWLRLVLPDGRSLSLGAAGPPAVSAAVDGSLGVTGAVNQHWARRYGAAVLLSLVGAGAQLSQPSRGGAFAGPSTGEEAAGALGLELSRLSQEILRQHIDLPPTIELRAGARVHALLVSDLAFVEPYRPL